MAAVCCEGPTSAAAKTVVAIAALLNLIEAGCQGVRLNGAPTEGWAAQQSIARSWANCCPRMHMPRTALLTPAPQAAARQELLQGSGQTSVEAAGGHPRLASKTPVGSFARAGLLWASRTDEISRPRASAWRQRKDRPACAKGAPPRILLAPKDGPPRFPRTPGPLRAWRFGR